MSCRKKRFATLIEVLIGIGLLSLLIMVLTGGYQTLTMLNRQTEEMRQESFQGRYLQLRLADVFTNILKKPNESKAVFFTRDEISDYARGRSLTFAFNNGAVIDAEFSGAVLGKVAVTTDNELALYIWPMRKDTFEEEEIWPPNMVKEVLMNGVVGLEMLFYIPQVKQVEVENQEVVTEGSGPDGEYVDYWEKEWEGVPAIVTLFIQMENGRVRKYALPVPQGHKVINYLR